MKVKIIIIISLAIIVVWFAFWQEQFVANTLSNMLVLCEDFKTSVEENNNLQSDAIQEELEILDTYWQKREEILCFMINHNDMKDVGDAITNLKTFTMQNDKPKSIEKVNLLIYYVNSYSHLMQFNLQNLF